MAEDVRKSVKCLAILENSRNAMDKIFNKMEYNCNVRGVECWTVKVDDNDIRKTMQAV